MSNNQGALRGPNILYLNTYIFILNKEEDMSIKLFIIYGHI